MAILRFLFPKTLGKYLNHIPNGNPLVLVKILRINYFISYFYSRKVTEGPDIITMITTMKITIIK